MNVRSHLVGSVTGVGSQRPGRQTLYCTRGPARCQPAVPRASQPWVHSVNWRLLTDQGGKQRAGPGQGLYLCSFPRERQGDGSCMRRKTEAGQAFRVFLQSAIITFLEGLWCKAALAPSGGRECLQKAQS